MKLHHIIYTEHQLVSPRWQTAMPDAQLETEFTASTTPANTVVWVVSGISNWQEIVRFYRENNTPIIVLTRNGSTEELISALQAGAKAYVELFSNTAILKQAIQAVTNGALWLPASVVTGLVGALTPKLLTEDSSYLETLTKREMDVITEIKTGASNKEIARKLLISERTVKEHLSSIFSKLEVSDRFQLLLKLKR